MTKGKTSKKYTNMHVLRRGGGGETEGIFVRENNFGEMTSAG